VDLLITIDKFVGVFLQRSVGDLCCVVTVDPTFCHKRMMGYIKHRAESYAFEALHVFRLILAVLLLGNALRLASWSSFIFDETTTITSRVEVTSSSANAAKPQQLEAPSENIAVTKVAPSKIVLPLSNEWANIIRNIPFVAGEVKGDDSDPRPRNLRLVIMGDSMSRYQYISLAHFLKTGQWITENTTFATTSAEAFWKADPKNDQNTETPLYCKKPGVESRQQFYRNSNAMLRPNEDCDCRRYSENRYFVDANRGNYLTYITKFGKNATSGRWRPKEINNRTSEKRNVLAAKKPVGDVWRFEFWNETISHHVAKLRPKPNFLLFNAGLHPHDLTDSAVRNAIVQATRANGMVPIYKTTSYPNNQSVTRGEFPLTSHDALLCGASSRNDSTAAAVPFCLDVSWTADLYGPEHYYDNYHLKPYWNEFMNRQTLRYLQRIVNDNVPPAVFAFSDVVQ
jgi:hypothetical protein